MYARVSRLLLGCGTEGQVSSMANFLQLVIFGTIMFVVGAWWASKQDKW